MTGIASSANFREEDGSLEKRCGHCREWWPADTEFFHPAARALGGLHSWCIACIAEGRNARRAAVRAQHAGQAAA